jgi:hypothetical protein
MTFQYTTEYCLGRRGRVCRTYSGVQALIAIAFDLALGFTFGLIGLGLWLVRLCVVKTYRVVVALVSLPFRVVRAVSVACSPRATSKPAWVTLDEL